MKETHIDDLCPSCLKPHGSEWKDEWHGEVHYKVATCQHCGYDEIFMRSNELTSGKF